MVNDKCQSAIEKNDIARSLMLTNPNTEKIKILPRKLEKLSVE
jgi:hypothetical protein